MADKPAIDCLHNLDINRYYKIYKTLHEMMQDRGYTPVEEFKTKQGWISFYLGLLAQLDDPCDPMDEFGMIDNMILLFKKDFGEKRPSKTLMVYFHPFDSKLAQKDMNAIHLLMGKKNAQHLIIVANNKATPKVYSVLGIIGQNAQLFMEDELVFNVTKHQLVPKHSLASEEEKERIFKEYAMLEDGQIHKDLFPGIYVTDPVVKYYNFKTDDLIRIERPRQDGFFDLTYRIVTNPMADEK